MSAYRQNFIPRPAARHRTRVKLAIVIGAVATAALGLAIGAAALAGWTPSAPGTAAAPLRAPDALADARIEAFRAGYATAIEQGCGLKAAALGSPIGTR